ncbi:MAG: FadR/GntR family transcriptional regulator [Ilumatobacteraceae bacterium]
MTDESRSAARSDGVGIDLSSLRVPKAAELLAARLRQHILSGRLKAGSTLPSEAKLLAAVGVGRPALREAQRILESEGLLEVQRGAKGGAIITLPDSAIASRVAGLWLQYNGATLRDVYDTRALLEATAAERLAEGGDTHSIALLKTTTLEEHQALTDRDAWFETSLGFHARLVNAAGLRTLDLLGQMLRDITSRHIARQRWEREGGEWRKRAQLSNKSHVKLISLIEAGNGVTAKNFWNVHMNRAADMLFEGHDQETVLDLFDLGGAARDSSDRTGKAADILAERLRRQIVHGELAEGTILPPENQLAESLQVGRPALREAMRILESEGLLVVERGSRGGARIHAPSREAAGRPLGILLQLQQTSIDDVCETRTLVQTAAARTIAERGSDENRAALRAAVEAGMSVADDPVEWSRHAVSFYGRLVELSGLSTLAYLGGLVEDLLDRHWANRNVSPVSRPEAANPAFVQRAQLRLVMLIEARDVSGAEAMVRAHLDGIQQRLAIQSADTRMLCASD